MQLRILIVAIDNLIWFTSIYLHVHLFPKDRLLVVLLSGKADEDGFSKLAASQ